MGAPACRAQGPAACRPPAPPGGCARSLTPSLFGHTACAVTQSATSCGIADNILWSQCGGPNATFPQVSRFCWVVVHARNCLGPAPPHSGSTTHAIAQMTVYDSLHLVNKSFAFYVNTTLPHGCDTYPKACDHGGWSELGDA